MFFKQSLQLINDTLSSGAGGEKEIGDSKKFLSELFSLKHGETDLQTNRSLELSPHQFGVATRNILLERFEEAEILVPEDSHPVSGILQLRNGHKVTQF